MKITRLQSNNRLMKKVVAGACNCNTCCCCNFKIKKAAA